MSPIPIILPADDVTIERFWSHVMVGTFRDCWEWEGALSSAGYGSFKQRSYEAVGAHRFAYAIHYNRDPGPLLVCHRCDNRKCCNPHHLFLGTVKDNSRDMARKGRARNGDNRGEKNARARLKETDVRQIRRLFDAGLNNKQIAKRYDVTHSMISCIRTGKSWIHVK